MADLVLSCRDRASFCSSVWSSWTSAPFDLHLVAEDGVVGAHSTMILPQSRQLAAIVKALPYTTGPTQFVLPGTNVEVVAAAKELICTGSCLLGEAIIPEVLKTLDVLGIKLSIERLCFENGATAPLKIQSYGDLEEVTASGVRESHEKISAASIKTENDDPLSLETASSQTKEKLTKNKKKEKVVKKKSPTTLLQATHKEEKTHQCKLCPKNFSQKERLEEHIENVHTTHQCEFCAKKFSRREKMCEHIKAVHKGGDLYHQFQCKHCSVIFGKKKVLEKHMMTFHSKEKLHGCKHCLKRFREESHLAQHMKASHSTDNRFPCKRCKWTFMTRGALKAHTRKAHDR